MSIDKFKHKIRYFFDKQIPFLFIVDFDCKKPFVCSLSEAHSYNIFYNIGSKSNYPNESSNIFPEILSFKTVSEKIFSRSFLKVKNHLDKGDTYLLNLTFPSKININTSLINIFGQAVAPYKLFFKDKFVVFSPETFIKIKDNFIYTYPMKGTISATISNADKVLLDDNKEKWEHNTVVDLLRNDLSIISNDVKVLKYRYLQKISSIKGEFWQTSSEIRGVLHSNWQETFADDLFKLLPAGSISGAPKKKTTDIIRSAEIISRGYYTGIFGIFDGYEIDSAVSIRFIEKIKNNFFFKSGGGITAMSNMRNEYEELQNKIYIPSF